MTPYVASYYSSPLEESTNTLWALGDRRPLPVGPGCGEVPGPLRGRPPKRVPSFFCGFQGEFYCFPRPLAVPVVSPCGADQTNECMGLVFFVRPSVSVGFPNSFFFVEFLPPCTLFPLRESRSACGIFFCSGRAYGSPIFPLLNFSFLRLTSA